MLRGRRVSDWSLIRVLTNADFSWAAKLASLLLLPFAHEDLAIVFGAYFIVHDLMPVGFVAISLYSGIVASDFALYGIGAGARRLPWLSRYAIDERVHRFGDALKRNVFGLVAICRLVPGIVFVAFIACGWMRVPLRRFTVASLLISALYLPLALYLAIAFGDTLDDYAGLWTWPLLVGVMAAAGFARKRVLAFGAGVDRLIDGETSARPAASPATGGGKVALAERIPPLLFYAPLVLTWLGLALRYRCLTLPSAANPMIATGGMWGESKSRYFLDVAAEERCWIADFVVLRRGSGGSVRRETKRALRMLADAGLDFPLVAKPDIGWHGYGVRRIDDAPALVHYLWRFPIGAKLILQRLVPHDGEAAVLYARLPGEPRGRILSLTFRQFPHVIGDGCSTLRELICADPRLRWKARLHLGADPSHHALDPDDLAGVPARGKRVQVALIANQRAGGSYQDAGRCITEALEARFDAIARGMREFHYGRFDIRFACAEALMRGEDFSIIEINGVGGEAIDAWDPLLPVREVYRRLLLQQRLLFAIGDRNRTRGFQATPPAEFLRYLFRQTKLIRHYPPSS